jgi:hypothetical protein
MSEETFMDRLRAATPAPPDETVAYSRFSYRFPLFFRNIYCLRDLHFMFVRFLWSRGCTLGIQDFSHLGTENIVFKQRGPKLILGLWCNCINVSDLFADNSLYLAFRVLENRCGPKTV